MLALGGITVAATPAYPLKLGPTARYLVDQNDRPFLIQGDSPWSLLVQPTREEVEQYLSNRRHKGFNSIIVSLIEHFFCDDPPNNRYGDAPFTEAGNYATPNEAYFAHVDWVLKKAAEYGIQVLLVPSYLGSGGGSEGWYSEMQVNGVTKLRQYGRYLGQRYKDFDNLIWLNGGDYNPPVNDYVDAIADGIRDFDTRHLQSAHGGAETTALDCHPTEAWLAINDSYTYENILGMAQANYAHAPTIPFYLIESKYEGDRFNASNQEIRRQAYWSVFSGACGQFMGNHPLYEFSAGWQPAMDGVASRDMANFRRLLDSRSWWLFVPDVNPAIVLAGGGDPASSDPAQSYVTAASMPDGSSLWAYVPTGRTLTLDLSQVSGATAQTWWYNPRTGVATAIGQFDTGGYQDFTTPTNEGDLLDWILVADDASRNLPPPGMTTLQDWRNHYFTVAELLDPEISGNPADPDHDGRNNLMEYALAGDPTVPDAALTPVDVSIVTSAGDPFLHLAYTRRKNAADLVFAVTAGNDLQTWSRLVENTTLDHGLTETVTVQDHAPLSGNPQRFVRLETTVTP